MNNQNLFDYSSRQQKGLFFLLMLVIVIQGFVFFFPFHRFKKVKVVEIDKQLNYQLDSLRNLPKETNQLKPFNPNFISDYKGYQLGMSVIEIDRLHQYRKKDQYVNSAKSFQNVTQVSDSLLSKIQTYFKFPDFVNKQSTKKINRTALKNKIPIVKKGINQIAVSDLLPLKGIGTGKANTLIKYRNKLGGFTFSKQLDEVWGLKSEDINEIWKYFEIQDKPKLYKTNVNEATAYQLSRIVYIDYKLAYSITSYRKEVAEIQNLQELKEITNFPKEKFDLISLYLQVE